jgi:hypothetical protein
MNKTIYIAILLAIFSFAGSAQENRADSTAQGNISVNLFWGLHKWGNELEPKKSFYFSFETSNLDKECPEFEKDSRKVKSILWGAIQWTEKITKEEKNPEKL